MTFRTRLLLLFLPAALLPVVVLALIVRHEMTTRLTAQVEQQVAAVVAMIQEDLARQGGATGRALARLRISLADDNRFRRGAVDRVPVDRRYLLDYGGDAMALTGLSMLQIQDGNGRILSSGHFRNEFDRLEPALPMLLAHPAAPAVLVEARAPAGPFLALVRADSFQVNRQRFVLVGGRRVEGAFLAQLARGAELSVALIYPGGVLTAEDPASSSEGSVVGAVEIPFIDAGRTGVSAAQFRITHRGTALRTLQRRLDRWFLMIGAGTVLLCVLLISALATRISRPLAALADKTARLDLDRLDLYFETDRKDEIGALSRMLGAMTKRLRRSAVAVKEAERRATLGELARQVNHDIKNGLTPIRNVLRHLARLAATEPEQLPAVFRERQDTLEAGITYLETLASNYARLSPRNERCPCDVNAVVRRIARDLGGPDRPPIHTRFAARATVLADPVSLRRIVENLVDNALDSLAGRTGGVTVTTEQVVGEAGRPLVRIMVADEGVGMSEATMARIFEDFYTAKAEGTGLGLSIVRRLVMDLDGTIRVESEEGKGSRFTVDLPDVGSKQGGG